MKYFVCDRARKLPKRRNVAWREHLGAGIRGTFERKGPGIHAPGDAAQHCAQTIGYDQRINVYATRAPWILTTIGVSILELKKEEYQAYGNVKNYNSLCQYLGFHTNKYSRILGHIWIPIRIYSYSCETLSVPCKFKLTKFTVQVFAKQFNTCLQSDQCSLQNQDKQV